MSLRLLVLLSLLATACGPLTPPQLDGGAGGGGAATGGGGGATTGGGGGATTGGGGGSTTGGGGGSTTGGGGGSTTGGGGGTTTGGGGGATGGGGGSATGGGGGSATGGGGGGALPFSWVRLTFNPAPSTTSTSPAVVGLGRRSGGDTWVAFAEGTVYRAPAGSDQAALITGFPQPTGSTTHADLTATSDEVLLLRGRSVFRCTGTCDTFADFASVYTVPSSLETPFAFCVKGSRVLFTSHLGSTTLLYESARTGATLSFTPVSTDLGVDRGERCTIADDGDVYVPSGTGVAILRGSGGVAMETIDLQGQPGARWTSVATSGAAGTLEGYLVGGGSGLRFARRDRGTATWKALAANTAGPLMTTVLAVTAADVLAGGLTNDGSSTQTLFRWGSAGLTPLVPAPPVLEVQRGLVAGPDDVYVGGLGRAGSGGYVVLHGSR